MSWLFPLYLAGVAAVIAPILLHLRRRPPKDRVAFSSLMFLEQTERQPTRRRRLENWLLLLARCLILILIAGMFARPFQRGAAQVLDDGRESLVVLVDRSASMRRGDLWTQALKAAREAVTGAGLQDRVALGVFDAEVEWLWTLEEDEKQPEARAGVAASRLAELKPGWAATDLGAALVAGLDALGGAQGARQRFLVVSDFQEGARLEALRRVVWPESVELERALVQLPEADNGNLSLALVAGRENDEDDTGALDLRGRVRVSSTREARDTTFELRWEGEKETPPVQGFVPPGGSRVLRMPPRAGVETPGVLLLSGDAHDFDNRVFVAPEQPREVRVRVAATEGQADEAASPVFYLKRALQPTSAIKPVLEPVTGNDWGGAEAAALLVSPGRGARLGAAGVRAWLEAFERGGVAVLVAEPDNATELGALTPGLRWTVSEPGEGGRDSYVMLGELETSDPLLRPFADPRLQDFTKVRFWRHRELQVEGEGTRVLARFDNGQPAMIAVSVGKGGTLLVLASGWHPADSQLALSTKFVPLLFGWLAAAGYAHEAQSMLEAGEALPWALQREGELLHPDGKREPLPTGAQPVLREPGLYQVIAGKEMRWLAVQVPTAEGRVAAMPPERLEEFGVRLQRAAAGLGTTLESSESRERLDSIEEESRQRFWWWTLIGVLALVLAETWLAGRSPRARVATVAG